MDNFLRRDIITGITSVTYYGFATVGTPPDKNVWLLVRETTDGTETVREYPDGKVQYNTNWIDRATYTYS